MKIDELYDGFRAVLHPFCVPLQIAALKTSYLMVHSQSHKPQSNHRRRQQVNKADASHHREQYQEGCAVKQSLAHSRLQNQCARQAPLTEDFARPEAIAGNLLQYSFLSPIVTVI